MTVQENIADGFEAGRAALARPGLASPWVAQADAGSHPRRGTTVCGVEIGARQ